MTAAAAPIPRPSVDAVLRAERPGAGLVPRLAVFGGLFLFAAGHWFAILTGAPMGRLLLLGAAILGGAAAIELSARLPLPRAGGTALRLVLLLATLELSLLAVGLDPKYLLPQNWGTLSDGIDRGLVGMVSVDWPYDGPDPWIRTTVLLLPALIGPICAAVAFWPGEWLSRPGRFTALAGLVGLYAAACAERDYGGQIGRGVVLLGLIAAFLWAPRLRGREAVAAVAAVAVAGLLSLPVASALDRETALLDYGNWDLFAESAGTVFDWNQDYGPIEWPRTGATMFFVKAKDAHYWKAETLDRFDGRRWTRSGATDGEAPDQTELPPAGRAEWIVDARVTISKLRSELVIAPGHYLASRDAGAISESGDGTARLLGDVLAKGDAYDVRGYAPDPSAAQMRRAGAGYPPALSRYTTLELPGRGALTVPLRGESGTGAPGAAQALGASPYGRLYRLSSRLVAGQATSYDAVRSVEGWLKSNLRYGERPPTREFPLEGFVFQDRLGYCQQFSGAMALMLRMNGIPARVAGGFSPGSFNTDTGEYRVRDLDAHSWVEVFFSGIGWVPFDPTPNVAPAESQASGSSAALGDLRDSAGSAERSRDRAGRENRSSGAFARQNRTGGSDWPVIFVALGALALAGLAFWARAVLAERRRLARGVEGELRWLRRLLHRAGSPLGPGTTLLGIEGRLRRAAPAAASYAGALREGRFAPAGARLPERSERRAARRQLMSRAGWRRRLRAIFSPR